MGSSHTRFNPRAVPKSPSGFLRAWTQLIGRGELPWLPRRAGRKPRVALTELLPALTYHMVSGAGTLSEHFFQLFGKPLADSSWADRRARLPWEIFTDLLQRALRPRAQRRRHADAFWRGWRLIALDGTQFSLPNTRAILATFRKPRARGGRAAFAKMTTAVLLELGLHNPIAAAIGRRGESEWALALRVLDQLPARALLLADRLYGCAAFAAPAVAAAARMGSHLLLCARPSTRPRLLQILHDGSRIIRVPVRGPRGRGRIRQWVELREIRVEVRRPGQRGHELRLWTTLRDPRTAPAEDLARVYASRWEHELYFRQLKRDLRKTALLQSHTGDTAAQEIAAMIMASALLAIERARAAPGCVPVVRVSFVKVLELVRPMWLMLSAFDDVLTDRQKTQAVRRLYRLMGRCISPPRRARACPRAVRQPRTHWPRLVHPHSIRGPLQFRIY
jgi:hypothetical protein